MSFFAKLWEALIHDLTDWSKVQERLGSNPGGVYQKGQKIRYVKIYKNPEHSRSEVATGRVYSHLGVNNLGPELTTIEGHLGVSTLWKGDLSETGANYKSWDEPKKVELAKHYVAAVTTNNWDAAGMSHENMVRDGSGGLKNVDLGAGLKFTATGRSKDFDASGKDFAMFRDKHLARQAPSISVLPTAEAFGSLGEHHIKTALGSMSVNHQEILDHMKDVGVADPEEHARTIVGRFEGLKRFHKS